MTKVANIVTYPVGEVATLFGEVATLFGDLAK